MIAFMLGFIIFVVFSLCVGLFIAILGRTMTAILAGGAVGLVMVVVASGVWNWPDWACWTIGCVVGFVGASVTHYLYGMAEQAALRR